MHNKEHLVKIIRRLQTFVSILIFVVVFMFSWEVTGFEITEIQLSKWGETGSTVELIWNSVVCTLAVSILINSILYISHNNRIIAKPLLYCMFSFISVCLFTVGAFNVNIHIVHNIAAYLFFFAYPLVIFIFSYINRKHLIYKDWLHHVIISIGMITLPLLCISLFNGMAIAETVHIAFVIVWNLKIAFK